MYIKIFLLFATFGLAFAAEGNNNDVDPISLYPYTVSIERNGKHLCSAALVSTTKIITAASCMEGLTPDDIKVRAGTSDYERGGVVLDVTRLMRHPRYKPTKKDYDIAVVMLKDPVTVGPLIKPCELPTSSAAPEAQTHAKATGWGITDGLKYTLEKIDLNIVAQSDCEKDYEVHLIDVTERMMCAGGTVGRENCKRDPGSPLVSNKILIGVSAWEQKCGVSKFPGIYTDVAKFIDWIDSFNVL